MNERKTYALKNKKKFNFKFINLKIKKMFIEIFTSLEKYLAIPINFLVLPGRYFLCFKFSQNYVLFLLVKY